MERALERKGAPSGTFGYDKAFAVTTSQASVASTPAKVPKPVKVNPLKAVEDAIEQNDNNFDGIINNMPPVANSEMTSANPAESREKPSVLEQLQAQVQQSVQAPISMATPELGQSERER